jgi:hypothetical protein
MGRMGTRFHWSGTISRFTFLSQDSRWMVGTRVIHLRLPVGIHQRVSDGVWSGVRGERILSESKVISYQ